MQHFDSIMKLYVSKRNMSEKEEYLVKVDREERKMELKAAFSTALINLKD